MIQYLEHNKCYQWIFPETCAGLIFKVLKIGSRKYTIRYLNSVHADSVGILCISTEFIQANLLNLVPVSKSVTG